MRREDFPYWFKARLGAQPRYDGRDPRALLAPLATRTPAASRTLNAERGADPKIRHPTTPHT
jgi:hypothetical protein